ncbi:hypothetical protein OHS33_22215 [Streptomyces sp. NBC_00536]|uniref:hypothetical protein n=1 Tax=Streptomyces sp. NBC_00536 TaxID=2975769 RepID=UPI002E816050|nr:hypothetical protein [Streptomyces sp. NBC_00536]WUC80805.1 hypothetical protein OHS33_22215 [Streptomyces sp. NBC_00536]
MSEQQPNPYAGEPGQGGQGEPKWGPGNPGYGYPAPGSPGYGYPPPSDVPPPPYQQPTIGGAGMPYTAPAMGAPGMASFGIGDITIAGDQIITPSGPMPLKGAMWNATDFSRTEEKIPTSSVVLAIVFAVFCLLGLLFLLMKEKVTTGYIQVTVTSGGRHHATMIPATDMNTFPWVMNQLNYARSLSI